ncbi:MAG: response regulator [Gammaproteobacteria bacterium]|nr:response regulator [Gammaproteobacteria bacterium]
MIQPSDPNLLKLSKPELIDEIESLRAELAGTKVEANFQQYLHKTLSTAIKIGYWEWDVLNDRPVYLSEEVAEIMGRGLESMFEQYRSEEDYFKFVHPDDHIHVRKNLNVVLDSDHPLGGAHVYDYRIIRPDGEIRFVRELEYGKREEDGVVIRTYGAIQDITDHQESMALLEQSEQRFSSLFSRLPLGVLEQDWSKIKKGIDKLRSEGVEDLKSYFENNPAMLQEMVGTISIVSANEALLKIYGAKSVDELIEGEENSRDWWDENWAKLYASEIAELASPERIHFGELKETRMDGTEFETRLITSVTKGDEYTWKRISTIVEDVTERKKYETDLLEAKTEAEKANRAKTAFLSSMSHEIRTPMNAIIGMSQLALESGLNEKQKNYISKVNSSAKSLLGIINDILDFSKIEAEKLEMETVNFRLKDTIKNMVNLVKYKADEKAVKINIDIESNVPNLLSGDPLRLGQVLINLVNNAIKFSYPDKPVALLVALKEETDNEVVLNFTVRDQGIGISPEQMKSLFRPFSQADSSTTRQYGGTGLGLVISRNIIQMMGGDISVESEVDIGSVFSFNARFARPSQDKLEIITPDSNTTEDVDKSMERLRGISVLLVEDNEINQELVVELLSSNGIMVETASNGQEALDILRTSKFDLVLMDCQMPVMDGYEATRQIRLQKDLNDLPIIAMTANAMKGDREKALSTGMNDYIAKPINPDTVFFTMDRWIKQAV